MSKLRSTDEYLRTLDDRFVSSACRGDRFTVQYDLSDPDGLTFSEYKHNPIAPQVSRYSSYGS